MCYSPSAPWLFTVYCYQSKFWSVLRTLVVTPFKWLSRHISFTVWNTVCWQKGLGDPHAVMSLFTTINNKSIKTFGPQCKIQYTYFLIPHNNAYRGHPNRNISDSVQASMHACMHVCMRTDVSVSICVCMHVYMYVCLFGCFLCFAIYTEKPTQCHCNVPCKTKCTSHLVLTALYYNLNFTNHTTDSAPHSPVPIWKQFFHVRHAYCHDAGCADPDSAGRRAGGQRSSGSRTRWRWSPGRWTWGCARCPWWWCGGPQPEWWWRGSCHHRTMTLPCLALAVPANSQMNKDLCEVCVRVCVRVCVCVCACVHVCVCVCGGRWGWVGRAREPQRWPKESSHHHAEEQ